MLYSEFAPTSFDSKGAFLPDRQNWLVAPVGRSRDSDILEDSNFRACLALLGGESDCVEVHRFGHWGPGWFEIIIIDPLPIVSDRSDGQSDAIVRELESIQDRLDDYPVLDDDDLSQREYDAVCEEWEYLTLSDRIDLCRNVGVSIFAARNNNPYDIDDCTIVDRLRS